MIPTLEYRLMISCLTKAQYERIHQPMLRLTKWKMSMPSTTANIITKHPEITNLKSLWNRHIEHYISELLVRLNTPGLLEESTVRRLKQGQHRLESTECILTSQAILEGTEIKRCNLGLNVLQHAKALGLRIEENEITKSQNIDITQKINDIKIAMVLQKIGLAYEERE